MLVSLDGCNAPLYKWVEILGYWILELIRPTVSASTLTFRTYLSMKYDYARSPSETISTIEVAEPRCAAK
jgi:hypothetical protein